MNMIIENQTKDNKYFFFIFTENVIMGLTGSSVPLDGECGDMIDALMMQRQGAAVV